METLALPLFFSIFVTIYLIAYFIVFRNWSPKLRPEASSCLISLAHGTPAVLLATYSMLADSIADSTGNGKTYEKIQQIQSTQRSLFSCGCMAFLVRNWSLAVDYLSLWKVQGGTMRPFLLASRVPPFSCNFE